MPNKITHVVTCHDPFTVMYMCNGLTKTVIHPVPLTDPEIKMVYNYIEFDELKPAETLKEKLNRILYGEEGLGMRVKSYGDELLFMQGQHIIAHLPRTHIGE